MGTATWTRKKTGHQSGRPQPPRARAHALARRHRERGMHAERASDRASDRETESERARERRRMSSPAGSAVTDDDTTMMYVVGVKASTNALNLLLQTCSLDRQTRV